MHAQLKMCSPSIFLLSLLELLHHRGVREGSMLVMVNRCSLSYSPVCLLGLVLGLVFAVLTINVVKVGLGLGVGSWFKVPPWLPSSLHG